jgi:hypothetical protein
VSPVKYELGFYIPEDGIFKLRSPATLPQRTEQSVHLGELRNMSGLAEVETNIFSLPGTNWFHREEWCLPGCYAVWLL